MKIFKRTFFILLAFYLPFIAKASVYVPGARVVSYYLVTSFNLNDPKQRIDYHFDNDGKCRMTQEFWFNNRYKQATPIHYYSAEGYQLVDQDTLKSSQRISDKRFYVYVNTDGIVDTKLPLLDKYFNIKEIEKDKHGNWIKGQAYNPKDTDQKYSFDRYVRKIIYYGEDVEADKQFHATIAEIDGGIDDSMVNKMKKTGQNNKSKRDFQDSLGGIILYGIVIPFITIFILYGIPLLLISAIHQIPNILFRIGAIIYGISFIGSQIGSNYGFMMIPVLEGIVLIFGTYGVYVSIVHSRCPKCGHSNSKIIRTIENSLKTKEYIVHPNGEKELISSSTSKDYDDTHGCHHCGYVWTSWRML